MNTERLSQFPSGLITDTDIPAVVANPEDTLISSAAVSTYLTGTLGVILGLTVFLTATIAWMGFGLQKQLNGKLTHFECSKSIFLQWVSPERGHEYQLYKMSQARINRPTGR